jgi:iron complex outermembrane receptor protein
VSVKTILLVTSALVTSALASTAHAQTAAQPAAPAAAEDNLIGEIIVTAEKRAQSLQQVPVAISAFTSEKRDLVGIQSIVDQTNYTPGLTYQPSLDRLSLRGVGRLTSSHAADSGTAIYVDGVFTTSTTEAGRDSMFVQRTEVLRGPQGTLYGRNAIGGAFNVITKRPAREFGGEARMAFGNYDRQEYMGTVSVPLTDNLRAKFGFSRIMQGEGYMKNLMPDRASEGGVRNQTYYEAQLEGEVGKVDFWFYYGKNIWNNRSAPGTVTNGGSFAPSEINPYGTGGGIYPNAGFAYTGGLNSVVQGPVRGNPVLATGDLRVFQKNTEYKNSLHGNDIARTHLTYHFDNFDLKYIGGFQRYNFNFTNDTDGSSVVSYQIPLDQKAAAIPGVGFNCYQLKALGKCSEATVYPDLYNTYQEKEELYSHELNIATTWDKPVQFIGGVYFYHEKFAYPQEVFGKNQSQLDAPVSAVGGAAPANPRRLYAHTDNFFNVTSKAVFGQVDWKLTDTIKLTGGLRYTQDDKKGVEEMRLVCFAMPGCGASAGQYGSQAPAVDITLKQTGALTPAQIAAGVKQQGVIGAVEYDPVTGYAKRHLRGGWNAVTGTAGVEYAPNRRTLAYGRYSRGYKAGGFNAAVASGFNQFPYTAPEQMDAFEVGLKRDWTRRFQTNVSGFLNSYYDAQVPVSVPQASGPSLSIFYNVPRSIIQGVELESTWTPIDRLNIMFTYAYLDSHISKACCVSDPVDPSALQPGAKPAGPSSQDAFDTISQKPARGQDLKGASLPLSPKNKIALNVNYTLPVGTYGDLIGSASYLWRDEQYSSIFNREYNRTPSRDQVDLRLTFKDAKNRFSIIGYAQNVFDSEGYETLSGTRYSTGAIYQNYVLTDPRTYGVQLQVRF